MGEIGHRKLQIAGDTDHDIFAQQDNKWREVMPCERAATGQIIRQQHRCDHRQRLERAVSLVDVKPRQHAGPTGLVKDGDRHVEQVLLLPNRLQHTRRAIEAGPRVRPDDDFDVATRFPVGRCHGRAHRKCSDRYRCCR